MSQSYDQLARYYDLLHRQLSADIPFMLAMATDAHGPILELGCGSGRLLLPLAEAGHEVIGLDRSGAMLALARRRLAAAPHDVAGQVTLVEGEITGFSLAERQCAQALIGYNTLLHLQPGEVAAALTCLGWHLQPQGRLVIDTLNPLALLTAESGQGPALDRILPDHESGQWITVMSSLEVDEAAQTARVVWVFDASPANGGAVQRTVIPDDYHFLYSHQLEVLLADNGFELEALYGDYDRAPFDEEAQRLIALARLSPAPGSG